MAFAKLPDNLLSQQHKLAFYNTNPTRLEDHNAYCKVIHFVVICIVLPVPYQGGHFVLSASKPPGKGI